MSEIENNGAAPAASTISGSPAPAGKKQRINARDAKTLKFVGLIAVAAILLMVVLFLGRSKETAKASQLPNDAAVTKGGAASAEQDAIEQQREKMRVDELAKTGKSAIEQQVVPNPVESTATMATAKPGQGLNPNGINPAGGPAQADAQPAGPQFDQERLKGLETQLTQQLKSWGMSGDGEKATMTYERTIATSASGNGTGTSNTAGNSSQSNQAKRGSVVVPAFENTYAGQSVTTHDSDHPGSVITNLMTGPLAGAVLYGTGRMADEGTSVTYTDASFNGRKFKINAISLDEKTASDIVDGTYNGRYFTRGVLPIMMEGIKAFTAAKAQTGTSVTVFGGGLGGAQSTPPPTNEQAINAMISASASRADRAVSSLPQTGQAILNRGKTYGVVFLDPVYEGDLTGETQGSSAPTMTNTQNTQPGNYPQQQGASMYQTPGYSTPGTMPLPGQMPVNTGYPTAPGFQQYQQQYPQPYQQYQR